MPKPAPSRTKLTTSTVSHPYAKKKEEINQINSKIQKLTTFQKRVYVALTRIPSGRVTTYAGLANYLDCKSSQAVGQALKRNPFAPEIPCHRVIKSNTFHIGGFMGKTEGDEIVKKTRLLKEEGVEFDSSGVLIDRKLIHSFADDSELEKDDKELDSLLCDLLNFKK